MYAVLPSSYFLLLTSYSYFLLLDLSSKELGTTEALVLCELIKGSSLVKLDLRHNPDIGGQGGQGLEGAQALKRATAGIQGFTLLI